MERGQQLLVPVGFAVARCKFTRICTARSNLIIMSLHDLFCGVRRRGKAISSCQAYEGPAPRPNPCWGERMHKL